MNMIVGAILIGTAITLYLKQHPPLRSTNSKIYGVACGFGIFSVAFPMAHWAMTLAGVFLQLVAIGCCIVAAHDFRANKAVRKRRAECRELRNELQGDFERDRVMCNAFFEKGVTAERRRKINE